MALLTNEDRRTLWADFMRDASINWEIIPIGKAELRVVVNAIDQGIEDSFVSINNTIPEPGKSLLSKKQKYRIYKAIIKRKWEVE